MKSRLAILAILAILTAPALFAAETVLTYGGALYMVEPDGAADAVTLSRRIGNIKTTVIVPATADKAFEGNVQLEYDRVGDRLYVVWSRESGDDSQLLVSSLNAEGVWSEAVMIAHGHDMFGNLRLALTRAEGDDGLHTLLHAAWWRKSSTYKAEYAVVAFDDAGHVSTDVSDLDELAGLASFLTSEVEPLGKALYPPMAIAATTDGVDVVFGAADSTKLTRIRINPRLTPNARVWRPGKSGGGHGMPPSKLASLSTAPVQVVIVRNRVILYTLEENFRFAVYANDAWSPVRSIILDATLTREQVLDGVDRLADH